MPEVLGRLERATEALKEASDIGARGAPMLQVALRLAQGGWPVFPCGLDKAPLIAGGFRSRSPSAAHIKEWWKTHPEALPGICPGDQGLAALDVDSPGAWVRVEGAGISPNKGFVVASGGTSEPFMLVNGTVAYPRHVYVAAGAQPKLPGVVTRFQSGYVIAPGARRGDRMYRVTENATPATWEGPYEGATEAPKTETPLDAPEYERVEAAVKLIPNGPEVTREQYVSMAHMIKGTLGDAGLPIFLEWASRYDAGVDVAEDTRVFETIRAPKLGWLTLASIAGHHGFDAGPEIQEAAQNDFAEVPLPTLAGPTLPGEMGRHVLAEIAKADAEEPTPRQRLVGMLERVRDAKDEFERALAMLALRKSGFGPSDIRAMVGSLTQHQHSDEGNTLGELLKSPELLAEPAPAIPFLAWPGLKTLLAAREKTGKSTFALAGAAVASRGGDFLGHQVPQQRVLWVTEESLQIAVQRAELMGADQDHFVIVSMGINPRDQLQKAIERWAPQIVVIDTLYRFAGVEDENDAVAWMPILLQFDEITRAGIALLILAHAIKGSENGGYRGSSAIGGFVDAILEMKQPSEGDTLRKYAGRGRLGFGKPFTVQMLKDSSFILFEGAPKDAREQQVLAYIKSSPGASKRTIANKTHIDYKDLGPFLETLLLSKQIRCEGELIETIIKKGKQAGEKRTQDHRQWYAVGATEDFAEAK